MTFSLYIKESAAVPTGLKLHEDSAGSQSLL